VRAHQGLSDEYARAQRLPIGRVRAAYRTADEHLIVDLRHAPLGDASLIEREGLVRALVIPLTKDGEIVGVLNAYTKDPQTRFREDSIDLAHVLAAEAGVAIANAQLYEQALRGREFERALLDSLGTPVLVARPPGARHHGPRSRAGRARPHAPRRPRRAARGHGRGAHAVAARGRSRGT